MHEEKKIRRQKSLMTLVQSCSCESYEKTACLLLRCHVNAPPSQSVSGTRFGDFPVRVRRRTLLLARTGESPNLVPTNAGRIYLTL
jgi:hypothetical protein